MDDAMRRIKAGLGLEPFQPTEEKPKWKGKSVKSDGNIAQTANDKKMGVNCSRRKAAKNCLCVFEYFDEVCGTECPVYQLCSEKYLDGIEKIVSDFARKKTLEEIYSYVKNWNPGEEIQYDYYVTRECVDLKRYGAEMLKNDILYELSCQMEGK